MYVNISKSKVDGKQLTAIFYDEIERKIKTVHCWVDGYIDYTTSPRDKGKRQQYISRHRTNENWNDPMSAGTLSRYILWEHPLLSTAINNYIKMFRLKKY
jgi:hypothetical protein